MSGKGERRGLVHWSITRPVGTSIIAIAICIVGVSMAGRLAVGVFQSAENARKHADMLAAKGVASKPVSSSNTRPYIQNTCLAQGSSTGSWIPATPARRVV